MKIESVPIIRTGVWNGQSFQLEDLREIQRSFVELGLAGRLPVKIGHTTADNEPAQGWITAVELRGDTLYATLDQVPEELGEQIRAGRWRFVSVELLRDAKSGDAKFPWILDALAILGSARPAVQGLAGLDTLVATAALQGVTFEQRIGFSRELPEDPSIALRRENEQLRAKLHRQAIDSAIESAIGAGYVLPNARERFRQLFTLTTDASYSRVDLAQWRSFASTQPRPERRGVSGLGGGPGDNDRPALRADGELAAQVRALVEERASQGRPLEYVEATKLVLARDPGLANAYRFMHSDE